MQTLAKPSWIRDCTSACTNRRFMPRANRQYPGENVEFAQSPSLSATPNPTNLLMVKRIPSPVGLVLMQVGEAGLGQGTLELDRAEVRFPSQALTRAWRRQCPKKVGPVGSYRQSLIKAL